MRMKLGSLLLATLIFATMVFSIGMASDVPLSEVIGNGSGTTGQTVIGESSAGAEATNSEAQPAASAAQPEAPAAPAAQLETQSQSQTLSEATGVVAEGDIFTDALANTDLTKEVKGTEPIRTGIQNIAAWIVQILCYFIIAFLAVRIALDLVYITLPFCRGILANGFSGAVQGQGTGVRTGVITDYDGARDRYNRAVNNNNGNQTGRLQLVSNDALNAVAAASSTNQQGQPNNALKIYAKSEIILLVLTPILLILAASGALTKFGFVLADYLVAIIGKISAMV